MKLTPPLLLALACPLLAGISRAELIGFYSFDDPAAPTRDDSGSGNTLESAGVDPSHVVDGGFEGAGFEFDGFQRWVVPIDINPDAQPELTLGAWVKTATLDPGLFKVMGHDDGGWDRTIGLDNREGDFRYTSFIGNGRPVVGTPGPESVDAWTFLAVTYDQPNNAVTVYVDVDASTTDDPIPSVTEVSGFGVGHSTFSLGSLRPDNDAEGWIGSIDNAFVFDTVLDAGQIKQIRDGGKAAIVDELAPNDPAILVMSAAEVFGRLPARPGVVAGTVTVANTGAANSLTFSSIAVTGPQSAAYTVSAQPEALAPGMTGEITVAFDPGDTAGDFHATLVIQSNDAAKPEVTVDLFARVASLNISENLLAFYTFDDPANPLADSSGRANTLQEPGGAANPTYSDAAGVQGGAYTYDGGDRLIAPININPAEEPELTVGAWVKTASLEPGLRKVLGHDNGGWDRTIGLDNREGDFRYTAFIGNGRPVVGTPGPVSTDVWTFLAVTFDQPNNEVTVYVDPDLTSLDDDLVVVREASGFGEGVPTFAIGGLTPNNANEGWAGEIDNVFVAKGILSQEKLDNFRLRGRAEIERCFFGPPSANLMAFWPFDNAAAPEEDASGNDHGLDKTLAEPTYVPNGGIEGGAYEFDGTQRLVADIDINPTEIPEMTWGAWVKPADLTPGLRKIMGHDDGGWDRTIGLDNREGDFRYTSFIGTGRPVVDTPGPENTDDWTFLAVVYDEPNAEVTVYIDLDAESIGDELFEITEPTGFGAGQSQFSIGNLRPDNANEGWQGLIDNAFLYNAKLTGGQLAFVRDLRSGAILEPSGDNPDLVFSRDPVFANLDSLAPVTRSLAIRNGGRSEDLAISAATVTGPDAAFFEVVSFPQTLAPGVAGNVAMTFDSRGQVGLFQAQLRLESNDVSQPVIVLNLSATTSKPAVEDPLLGLPLISPFGSLPLGEKTRTAAIVVQNTGADQDLVISAVRVVGKGAPQFSVGALPGPIAPGESAPLEVTFDSAGQFGNFRASLEIVSNSTSGRLLRYDVSTVVRITNFGDALFAYYSFDDPNDPLKDASEMGGPALELVEGAEPTYLDAGGFEGTGAYEFDGGQRLIADIDINVDQIEELTLGAWVKPADLTPALRKIMGHDNGGWDRTIGLDNREGDFRYTSFIGNGRPVVGTPGPENADDWTFIAVVYDQPGQEVTVYVDVDASTVDDELVAVTEPTSFNTGQPTLSIGSLRPDNANEGWVGLIDRAFFFSALADPVTVAELREGAHLPGGDDPNIRLAGGFGDLGKNPGVVTRTISISNGGQEQTLNISEARIVGPNAANFTIGGEIPATIASRGSVTVDIVFDPQGRDGGFVAFLEVESDDPGDPTRRLDLSVLIPNANDLLAHFKLDEEAGETTMLDASGNGAHGTYIAAEPGSFTLGQASLAAGKAVSFDDGGDAGAGYGEVPARAGLPELRDFSVSLWVNQAADDTGVSALFAKGEGAGDPFAVATVGGALVWFSGGTQTLTVDAAITPGETTHVVTVFETVDGVPTVAFFINGVEAGREANVEPFDDSKASIFQIGALNSSFGFKGVIDDVQVYGQALDAEKVSFLFANPGETVAGTTPPPATATTSLFLLDFGSEGANSAGPAPGWNAISNLVQDVPVALVDSNGLTPGVSITALEDGFNPNNPAPPGTPATYDGVAVPVEALDDYLFKIADQAGTSAQMRIDGLPAGVYAVTVFEGRTTDDNQVGKIWVGAEPAEANTGNFAGGSATVALSVADGQALHYRHLEDNTGGISGMIIRQASGPVGSGELVAFYHFDDAGDPLADASGKGNTLSLPGGPADPSYGANAGREGGAFTYDGTKRLIAPININPDQIAELTVGAWVKTATLDPGLYKVLGHDNGGWDRTIGLDNREGDFRYTSFIGNGRPVVGTPGPESEDDWTFLAVAYDQPNNAVTVYIDLDVSTTADSLIAVSEPTEFGPGFETFAIGGIRPDNANEGWRGEIDNVFLVNGVLSPGQLAAIRTGGRRTLEVFGAGEVEMPPVGLPAITAVSVTANGFSLVLSDGASVNVEYSLDLLDWTRIATGVSGNFEDTDPGRAGQPAAYYRVVNP